MEKCSKRETAVLSEVLLEADIVAEESLVETAQVVGVVGVGVTIVFAEGAGEHAHLEEQVDGTQWGVDVCADKDDGLMAGQTFEEVATHVFLTRSDKQNEGAVGLWTMLALDAVGECKETTVTLVTIVGDDAWGQSCFSHVALHLVGNRFGIGTIQHGELADGAEVGWGGGAICAAIGVVVGRL